MTAPPTPEEILLALNERMNTLENDTRAAIARLDAFLADPPAGPKGDRGDPGEKGDPGPEADIAALTTLLLGRMDTLESLERQMRSRVHQVADEGEAKIQRAITSINLLIPALKGRDE